MVLAANLLPSDNGLITSYEILPAPHQANEEGILYISSGPWDHMRLSWLQRQIMLNFSQKGYHMLRFDLSGTGDSLESTDAASWQRWNSDCLCIRDSFRKSVRKIHVIGSRLGATLALKASESYAFRSMHLIDPVIDGGMYWMELKRLQQQFVLHQNRYGSHIVAPDELFGFPFGEHWQNSLQAENLQQIPLKGRRVYIYQSQVQPGQLEFQKHLEDKQGDLKIVAVRDNFAWDNHLKLHLQCFAQDTLQSITNAFAEL